MEQTTKEYPHWTQIWIIDPIWSNMQGFIWLVLNIGKGFCWSFDNKDGKQAAIKIGIDQIHDHQNGDILVDFTGKLCPCHSTKPKWGYDCDIITIIKQNGSNSDIPISDD